MNATTKKTNLTSEQIELQNEKLELAKLTKLIEKTPSKKEIKATQKNEYIAEINPDIMYVVDRTAVVGGEKNAAATLDNDLVNGTNAVKNGRVYELSPDVWYLSGGGLQSVSMMADDVAASVGK